jgi:hypothetical protein
MTVEAINSKAARMTIIGWLAGLAYYNWFAHSPPAVPFWGHVVLVIAGIFVASIFIGGLMSLLAAAITKLLTGRTDGSLHAFSWAAIISPIIAFFAAGYALKLFVAVNVAQAAEHRIFKCDEPLPEFTLGEQSNPTEAQLKQLCGCIWSKFPDGGWERSTSAKIRAGEAPGWRETAFQSRFGSALEECGGMSL